MVELVVKVGGQAGQGAFVTGRTLGRVFTRCGYNVIGYPEYPSLIRGGHNGYEIRISDKKINSPVMKCDIILALNKDGVFYHHQYLNEGGAIIYDEGMDLSKFKVKKEVKLYPMPSRDLLVKAGGSTRMLNVLYVGALLALVDHPLDNLKEILTEEFSRKGSDIVEANVNVAQTAYNYIKNELKGSHEKKVQFKKEEKKVLIGGNEAACIGAIRAGMKFYSAYPMTPASSLLHYLAKVERKANLVVKHTEDEIAAINYAVGASYAGVRAMTGSSGGGFALMTETVGMAGIAETPLVIVLAQRVGPSTGMPTWTEQGDLRFALHSSQGEFLRVVLAPGTVEESFYLTAESFNLAEKYQIPVIIMTDKFLAESHFSTNGLDPKKIKIDRGKVAKKLPKLEIGKRFHRYEITKDGISTISHPGQAGGIHVATSYEHDETGFTTESFVMRKNMVDKRESKLPALLKDLPKPKVYGPAKADVSLVTWGSQVLPCLDSLELLEKEGITANIIHFSVIYPLDEKEVSKLLSKCEKTIMIENNSTAQFAGILRENNGFVPDVYLLRYDGRQFFPEMLADNVKKIVKDKFKNKKVTVKEELDLELYNPQRYGL